MSHRQPQLKEQARLIRQHFGEKGLQVPQGEALELAARLNGFPSWNVASAHPARTHTDPTAQALAVNFTVWQAVHRHRHGEDVFVFDHQPSQGELVDHVNSVSSYEPEKGESVEVLGSDTFVVNVSEHPPVKLDSCANMLRVLEVNLFELLGDYDNPELLSEWQWAKANARFAHTGNGSEPGVFEFMVHVATIRADIENIPPRLRGVVEQAHAVGSVWVLFHQG